MKEARNKPGKKLIIALALCSILLIAAELLIAKNVSTDFSQLMQEQRKNSVSKMAQLAHHSIRPILDEMHTGNLDRDAARLKIVDLVRNMTYEDEYGDNYIFMSAYDGTMLVQPFEPQKEGSDQWDLQDAYGKYIIQDLIQAAKKKPGGSFVSYHYYLPKEDRIEEKLSYVIGIPEINAYIGTGMYIESSYQSLQNALRIQNYGFLATSFFILGFAIFYISTLIRTNQYLSREIMEREYAESKIRTVFDSIHDAVMIHDRNGKMIHANKSAAILYGIPENKITDYSIQEFSYDAQLAEEKLGQTAYLENASVVFEWKCRRPLDGTTFDGEVALRKSKWSGENVIVAVVRDISDRRKHEEEIRHLAYYDYLTSLHNRVFIMNELKQELEQGSTRGNQGAILFIDLDNFKKINDTFGHFYGDEVLVALADQLREMISGEVLPARIGGDEFVVLCYGADLTETVKIADQVLTIFRNPIMLHDNTIHLTCSMGIALYPKDGNTVEDIFKNADLALYSAKDQGKDNFVFYEEKLSAELQYKNEMEEQLRQGYYNEELVLHYQPIYDVAQQKVVGHEALIRWISPRYGMVMPNQIIPFAEEVGLIDKIGNWVIDSAFAFAKSVQDQGAFITCNVSPAQLTQGDFVENVLKKFELYQLREGSVALEITESCLIESFDLVARKLSLLREKGIRIYLDDFGTGYSSLNYLKNLPVDYIKIDKSFIDEIANSGMDSKILKTIILLAHEIGIMTVAEGVETRDQLEFLEKCGCDLIQGYLISRPRPAEEIYPLG